MLKLFIERFFIETEQEAVELIEEAKKTNPGNLLKYSSQHKEKYNKDGEQIYDYYKVTLNKSFNIEKESIYKSPVSMGLIKVLLILLSSSIDFKNQVNWPFYKNDSFSECI